MYSSLNLDPLAQTEHPPNQHFLLEQVIYRHPLVVAPETPLAEIIDLMSQSLTGICFLTEDDSPLNDSLVDRFSTSCVLVMVDTQLLGIFTEWDMVRLIATGGTLTGLAIADVMTRQVITLKATDARDVFPALNLMRQHRIRHLPILDEQDQLLGIVTPEAVRRTLQPTDLLRLRQVEEVMTPQAIHALSSASVLQVAQLITQHQVSCVVIVDAAAAQRRSPITQQTGQQPVANHRRQNPKSIDEQSEASRRVSQNSFPLIPIGIITERDIVQFQKLELDLARLSSQTVMSAPLFPLSLEDSLWTAHQQMQQHRVQRLVVTGPQGELKGVVTQTSLLQALDPVEMHRVLELLQHKVQQLEAKNKRLLQSRATQAEEELHTAHATLERRSAELTNMNQELQTTLQDLQVAEEGLRVQNEELRSNRQIIEVQRQRYEDLFNFAPDGYLITDPVGRIQEANQSIGILLSTDPKNLVGHPLSSFVPLSERKTFRTQLNRLTAGIQDSPPQQQKQRWELTLQTSEGEGFPVAVTVAARQDAQGRLIGLRWSIRDIIERKRMEQKVYEQAALLDVVTDAIFVQGLDNQILFWSQGAETLYGWTASEALRKDAKALLHRDSGPQFEAIQQALAEQDQWRGELRQVAKAGRAIIVDSRWTLMKDEAGNPKSTLVVNTDITEKKQLEAQFLRAQRLESLGVLAGGIAHDLNNILTPILASTQLLPLKFPQADPQTQRLLEMLKVSAERGATLVKQVLSFSRGVEGEYVVLQVRHLISEILQMAEETFPKSIELHTNIPQDLWTIYGDATQLHQVLMNLCINARDAMPNGGFLRISAENLFIDEPLARRNLEAQVGPYILITVSDTGVGVPPDSLDKIFDPFFTTKEVGQGTGLGLSTVLGIVKNHGGFVQACSEVGQGAQFQVYLPIAETPEGSQIEEPEPPLGKGELILIVDDEALIREMTKTSLETYNYKVLTASNGIEAISLYGQHKDSVNAVLMDMMMPSMDGVAAIRTLQRSNPQVKIIAVSGLAASDQLAAAMATGVETFLPKPYTSEALLKTLHEVLNSE